MIDKLKDIERRFDSIEAEYNDPAVVTNAGEMQRLGKLRAELEPVVMAYRDYDKALTDLRESEELLADPEMKELAQTDVDALKPKIADLESKLKAMLVPKDPLDDKPVIMEIRPAAGGDEAGLFANELFRMYLRYAEGRRWKVEIVDHEENGIGGLSRVVFNIDAQGSYSQLKHESGVHRVQRVPATESQGRIHTSTVTVAVLPEAEEVDLDIKNDDLEISTFCSSSAGGQHMQKNETAIRIIHKPTGLVSTCQEAVSDGARSIGRRAIRKSKGPDRSRRPKREDPNLQLPAVANQRSPDRLPGQQRPSIYGRRHPAVDRCAQSRRTGPPPGRARGCIGLK